MNMYSKSGAIELARNRKKTCYFWSPKGLSHTNHPWVHDPSGTKAKYSKPNPHAYHMIIDRDGKII